MKSIVVIWLMCFALWALAEDTATTTNTDETDKYVLYNFVKANWFRAQAICASQNYTLISIPTYKVNEEINTYLLNSTEIIDEPIWASGSNLANVNRWSWYSTGATFTFRRFSSPPGTAPRCVAHNGLTGDWTALSCTSERYFMCEKRC
ncbi:snaclec mucetin subunit beta [Drosophila busckii]|nr:snaclec mucetin subunit beta [Drosophila busckii]